MKLLEISKDGGPESHVWAYWLFEIKWLGSIVLLKFEDGSRDAFHSHAFNCISWVLGPGYLRENTLVNGVDGRLLSRYRNYLASLVPVITRKTTFHKVNSRGRTWVLSFRGPWAKTWKEYTPDTGEVVELTSGRQVVG